MNQRTIIPEVEQMRGQVTSNFIRQIRAEQKAQGLSHKELMRRAGMHEKTVFSLSAGVKKPMGMVALLRLASALDCEVELVLVPRSQNPRVRFAARLIASQAVPILEDLNRGGK